MKRIIKCVMLFNCFLCVSIQAFIYDICVMRKWNLFDKKYSYVIGLGDFHCKRNNQINRSQIKQLDTIISNCPKNKIKIIVEDVSSPNCRGRCGCGRYFINSRGGILGGLANKCKDKGFKNCQNIEYRFCRVVSLAPILNNLRYGNKLFTSYPSVRVGCLSKEILEQMRCISRYSDGKFLNKWYTRCMNSVITHMKLFKFDENLQKDVKSYVDSHSNPENRLHLVKKLLTFDSSLIDITIVHAIVNASCNHNTLVVAGGFHVKSVCKILQKLGYETMYKTQVKVKRGYDTNKSLGYSITPGGFCCRPEPVDLKVLKRFL